MGILAALDGGPAQGVVGVVLVQPVVLIQHGHIGGLDAGHIPEHIPHDLKMVVHFPAAAHIEALGNVLAAIAAAAGQVQLLQQVHPLALHLSVTDQVEGGGQTGQAGADNISGLVVHALRLLGMGKGFIGSSRIIHILCSSFFVRQPRTFYTGAAFCFSLWPYCTQSSPFSQ